LSTIEIILSHSYSITKKYRRLEMRTTKVLTLSLPPEMVKEVETIARKEKMTKSELFREALRKYINERRWIQIRQWGLRTSHEMGILTEENVDELVHQYRRSKN
jgi:metal-responsive CopG/Arc/MetJ family transcriptional regulator